MIKLLLLSITLSLAALQAQSQCNPAFTVSQNNQALVQFQAVAGPGLYHSWKFGDNSYGAGYIVTHTYASPGTYTVKHYVTDSTNHCSDSSSMVVSVNFTDSCVASFTSSRDSLNGQYHFTSTSYSSGTIQQYSWSVNGNTVLSGATATNLNYTLPIGVNTVCLTTTGTGGCNSTTCKTIVVSNIPACNVHASFTDSARGNRQVSFAASPSSGPYRYQWRFGDNTMSTEKNPWHQYYQGGSRNVCLVVTDTLLGCRDSVCRTVYVYPTVADSCTTSFTYSINPSNPAQVTFTGVSNQTIGWQGWYIFSADSLNNTYLSGLNPTYTFPAPGLYTICLRQGTTTGCEGWSCDTITLGGFRTVATDVVKSYPNPAAGSSVNVPLVLEEAARIKVSVYNTSGNAVYSKEWPAQRGTTTLTIPVDKLKQGQYFIDIQYGNQRKRSIFQKL